MDASRVMVTHALGDMDGDASELAYLLCDTLDVLELEFPEPAGWECLYSPVGEVVEAAYREVETGWPEAFRRPAPPRFKPGAFWDSEWRLRSPFLGCSVRDLLRLAMAAAYRELGGESEEDAPFVAAWTRHALRLAHAEWETVEAEMVLWTLETK